MTRHSLPVFPVAVLAASLLAVSPAMETHAQVVLNEIGAVHDDRQLRWTGDGQPWIGSGTPWWAPDFAAAGWKEGETPIGFGFGGLATDVGPALRNVSPSLYVRASFEVPPAQATAAGNLVLEINANDGFIAWVNGREVGRVNMGPEHGPVYRDQVAYRAASNSTTPRSLTLGPADQLLVPGGNTLAIHVANASINLNGNLRLDMRLAIGSGDEADELLPFGSAVRFLPGLLEPSSDVFEPALLDQRDLPVEASDWIELHNRGAEAANLDGWSLTDDAQDPAKWRFPAGTVIPPGGFLLVLADDPEAPIPGAVHLHAGFRLDGGGEFLGLFDGGGGVVDQFAPSYPRQLLHHSYGIDPVGGGHVFFADPTPGGPNGGLVFTGRVDAPDFDREGGFHDDTVVVAITTETPGGTIRYTTDGTEPTETTGTAYSGPLTLERLSPRRGHVIRARAFAPGLVPSKTRTHTYLIGQDPRLRTAPALVYAADLPRSLYDPFGALAIMGGRYVDSQWQAADDDDFNNVINRGRPYERPIHAEFYFADGAVGFRTDCGVRIAASSYSRPRMTLNQIERSPWPYSSAVEKPSFNLYFRDEYGNPDVTFPLNGENARIDVFEQLRIRAGKNDINNPFIIDELVRRLSEDMGQPASTGVINSLYVNGEFKGFFNTVERLRAPFFAAEHGSPPGAAWDVLQAEGNDNVADGDKLAWNDLVQRLRAPVSLENWERVVELADVVNMADYFLLNIYMAMWDWPQNNWVAARERSERGRFRLYVWDAEGAMNNRGGIPVSDSTIDSRLDSGGGEMRDLWRGLVRWEEFRVLFSDRINRHLFHGGVLDDRDFPNSRLAARMDQLVDEFDDLLSLVAGQSVNANGPRAWASPQGGRRTYLFGPRREDFRTNGLWPEVTPPEFSRFGGSVPRGFALALTNEIGEIVFTTDGSDPRLPGGGINPAAKIQPGSKVERLLVPAGASWRILDDGTDPDESWRLAGFDDAAWAEGAAPLGFGGINDTELATEVNAGRHLAFHARRTFEVDDASAFLDLRCALHVDDGAVVYLNGVEALRDGMPDGPVDAATPADASGNEGVFDDYLLDPALLVDGTNVIAVEVHNSSTFSSDMVVDLRLEGTRTNPESRPVVIVDPVTVRARSHRDGVWSAVTEADFTVETVAATSGNLAIVEMLYNPAGPDAGEAAAGFTDGDQFEYLRIRNIGDAPVDLHGVRFVEGIDFAFSAGAIRSLMPGGEAILVSDPAAFQARFGTAWDDRVAGQYRGRLNNGGERLRLVDGGGSVIHDFTFDNRAPWPELAALDGHSIVLAEPGPGTSPGEGGHWRASAAIGGTLGAVPTFDEWRAAEFTPEQLADPSVSGTNADFDGDGFATFVEFALGTPPLSAANGVPGPAPTVVEIGPARYLALVVERASGAPPVAFGVETSPDLEGWSPGDFRIESEIHHPDGSMTLTLRDTLPFDDVPGPRRFLRLVVSP